MNHQEVRKSWENRQQEHGNHPRAVLMKGLHPLINESIDLWHRDVMRRVFSDDLVHTNGAFILDVGCGFGRLADEITRFGHIPIGIDFTQQFCVGFAAAYGNAICADQTALPFTDGAFVGSYSVTSLMYLEIDAVRRAVIELDRCLSTNGLMLILEPCREFNELVRMILPEKRSEQLAMPGFSLEEIREILPGNWIVEAAGNCRWLTFALPFLVVTTRWPKIYRCIAALARWLDKPGIGNRQPNGRITMYRWIACRKFA